MVQYPFMIFLVPETQAPRRLSPEGRLDHFRFGRQPAVESASLMLQDNFVLGDWTYDRPIRVLL